MSAEPRVSTLPVRRLATAGLAAVVLFAALTAIWPLLRPDVDPVRDGLSHYARGPWGMAQSAGFVLLAAAAACIGGALALAGSTPSGVLLLAAAPFALGLAAFPMGSGGPTTPIGDLHLTSGTLAIVLQFAAMLALLARPAGALAMTRFAALALVALAGAALIQLAIWRPELGIPEGLAMRAVAAPALFWWGVVAFRLRRFGAEPPPA